MKNCQDALGELFRLLKLQGNSPKPEIEDAGATAALIADDGVGIGSDHGDTLGFALNREGGLRNGCWSLLCQGSCGR